MGLQWRCGSVCGKITRISILPFPYPHKMNIVEIVCYLRALPFLACLLGYEPVKELTNHSQLKCFVRVVSVFSRSAGWLRDSLALRLVKST